MANIEGVAKQLGQGFGIVGLGMAGLGGCAYAVRLYPVLLFAAAVTLLFISLSCLAGLVIRQHMATTEKEGLTWKKDA